MTGYVYVAPVLKHGLRSHSPMQVDDVVNI